MILPTARPASLIQVNPPFSAAAAGDRMRP
jgi:hypothetical protein